MAINTYTPNTVIKSSEENANWQNFLDHGRRVAIKWTFAESIETGNGKDYFRLPDGATWDRVDLLIETPPTGAAVIVDIDYSDDNGASWTTIFTTQGNRPQIAASGRVGNTTTIDVDQATANDRMYRAAIDQVGSTEPGQNLSVILSGNYNVD